MARRPRCQAAGITQHIVQRGNNRTDIFRSERDFSFFQDWLGESVRRYACRVHAYCFMRNHVHLLVTPDVDGAVSKVMQTLGIRYVQYFNKRHQRTGTLWEGRYYASAIDTARYLLGCYRYIEMNPVRAGITTDPRDYRWSSYAANALGRSDALITPHSLYDALGRDHEQRLSAYRELFQIPIDNDTRDAIRR